FAMLLLSILLLAVVSTISAECWCDNGLNRTEVDSITSVHNNLRMLISAGKFVVNGTTMPGTAKTMGTISWDCALERDAVKVAATCSSAPNNTNTQHGQNSYFFNATSVNGTAVVLSSTTGRIATAAGIWAGEFARFGWPSIQYTPAVAKLGISEATQMAWAKTRKVGCGAALCNSNRSVLVVCRYRVAGNVLNNYVYPPANVCG
ncbi:hypothetical protein PENTCL1PPCAC_14244, partial [Pristionchus entomophagus]